MNIKWDAKNYTDNFNFVPAYGNALIEMIKADPGSRVLDLGCGSGSLTKELYEKGFKVIGIDDSEDMLAIACKNYPEIPFVKDNAISFQLDNPVDVIFSNAVFHWINKDDQEKMINCVANALKSGGEFIFEFGGYGNNGLIHKALNKVFQEYGYNYVMPFYFPSIGEYSSLLEKNDFIVTDAFLFDRPTKLNGKNGLKDWLKMFVQKPFEVIENEKDKEEILERTVAQLKDDLYKDGFWYSDYVRLRMRAVKK